MTTDNNPAVVSRLHLDPVGGVAGDMFVAAMLDIWPDEEPGLLAAVRAAGLPQSVSVNVSAHADHALTGRRFVVAADDEPVDTRETTSWRSIRAQLAEAALPGETAARATDIFARLARAEAQVHGVDKDDVHFHEVGAWDSIADIVAAAYMIDRHGGARWSAAALPLGSGRVASAHGALPVPAPATALLLEGCVTMDDGIPGERITPTGAAIIAHLAPDQSPADEPATLHATGTGFGTRKMPGISNVLRILAFSDAAGSLAQGEVAVLRFEVDDQSPEDLAVALDRLRAAAGVLDVTQAPVFGKKGRIAAHVQVLAEAPAREAVTAMCLNETTTLGVRWELTRRTTLARDHHAATDATGGSVRVKTATRPDGRITAKTEMDDVAKAGDRAARAQRRQDAEQDALDGPGENSDADESANDA